MSRAYDPEQTQSNKRKLVDQCREQEKTTEAAGGSGVFSGVFAEEASG